MGLGLLYRRGANSERYWPENGIVLWSFLLLALLCLGNGRVGGAPITTPTEKGEGEGIHILKVITTPPSEEKFDGFGKISAMAMVAESSTEIPEFTSYREENETEEEVERFQVAHLDWERVQGPMIISLTLLIATLAKIVFHFHNKLSTLIPESCLLIVVGVIIGIIFFYTGFVESDFYQLESDLFFFILLPPIILDAGYFMPQRAFFDNIGTILLYAIIGTLLNTLLLGFSLWGVSYTDGVHVSISPLNLLEVLTFAALLSAVDPVAVLAVFEEAHVNEVLYIIVFGESLLNDGVTVVLYHMFEGFTEIGEENLLAVDIGAGILSFFVVAGCGTLIGIVFGCIASLLTRVTDHIPVIQPLLVLIMGYMAYVFAEMFHLSGILSCTFCGITMRRYVEANMSRKSHTTTKYFLKLLGSVSETVVFMYLGFSTVTNTHHWDWGFCLITLVACLVFRFVVVVFLTKLVNIRRMPKLGKIDQFIMSYGGLRGAIAFSLVIVLDENLFVNKNLYITTTVFVVYFTNFIMGSTIKPLVKALRVPRADKHKPSLNEQIHTRFVDHLMAGIEDISGQSGHHQLREKFEYLDKNYLQRIFVRKDAVMKRGWSIVSVFDKLNERDAYELLQGNNQYSELFQQMQRDPFTLRNMSFYKLLSSIGNRQVPNGYTPGSTSSFDIGGETQTQIDLQALEAQDTRKMRDDSKVHHIIEDVMFMPRKRYTSHHHHRRHVPHSDSNASNHTQEHPLHHNNRVHLRHLLSHHHENHHCNGHHHNNHHANGHNGKPKKNVSFAEVAHVASSENDPDAGSTRAESSGEDSDRDTSSASDLGGITFTADSTQGAPDEESVLDIPVEPVAVEMSLPWKRNTGREPLTSAMTHSMPDDQHPLIGEAPSWVNNTEYTSPGSPPATPQQSPHPITAHPAPPSHSSGGSDGSDDKPNPFQNQCNDCSQTEAVEMNLISLDTPKHEAVLPVNRPIRSEDENDNHDRTVGNTNDDNHVVIQCKAVPVLARDASICSHVSASAPEPSPVSRTPPVKFYLPSITSTADNNGNIDITDEDLHDAEETPAALPWRSDDYQPAPAGLPWRDNEPNDSSGVLPWRQDSNDNEATNQLPWRSNNNGHTDTESEPHIPETEKLPWRQNSQDSDNVTATNGAKTEPTQESESCLPWRTPNGTPIPAKVVPVANPNSQLPLPWKQNSLDQNDETASLPAPWKHKGEGEKIPPRVNTDNVLTHKNSKCNSGLNRPHSDAGVDNTDTGPPLPWRNISNDEVKLDPCIVRPPPSQTVLEPPHEESHVPPPPWRHVPDPESSIRSPSATGTFYSLKPQLSSQSFRISEAESKHSEPIHVHHMIDIPHGRPIFDMDCTDSCESLDLDHEQIDLHERVMLWLMTSEPEPFQADDFDPEPSGINNNTESNRSTESPARSNLSPAPTTSSETSGVHSLSVSKKTETTPL